MFSFKANALQNEITLLLILCTSPVFPLSSMCLIGDYCLIRNYLGAYIFRSYEITRKDRLYKNVQRMQQTKVLKCYCIYCNNKMEMSENKFSQEVFIHLPYFQWGPVC